MGCSLVADVLCAALMDGDHMVYDEALGVGPFQFVVDGTPTYVAGGFRGTDAEPVSVAL